MDIKVIYRLGIALFIFLASADAYANGRGSSSGYYTSNNNARWGNGYTQHHYQRRGGTSYGDYQNSRNSSNKRPINHVVVTASKIPRPYSRPITIDKLVYFKGAPTTPNRSSVSISSSNQTSRIDKKISKQCLDDCLKSFGMYYKSAKFFSPMSLVGAGTTIATALAGDGAEDILHRRGLHHLHGETAKERAKGRLFIAWSKMLFRFNTVSLVGGGVAAVSQYVMEAYCKDHQCSKKTSHLTKYSRTNRVSKSKYRYRR